MDASRAHGTCPTMVNRCAPVVRPAINQGDVPGTDARPLHDRGARPFSQAVDVLLHGMDKAMMSTFDPLRLDAVMQAQLVRASAVAADVPVRAALTRIDRFDPTLNCLVSDRREKALAEVAACKPDRPFRGVPVLVKDLGCGIAGEQMWNGNRTLKHLRHRATADSRIVQRLREAGFAILGRSGTAEFGATITTEPSATGITHNPWDHTLSPGGSSGGSAAAVAVGFVPIAHGTDASGSVRIPASCCGVIGFKPSNGTVPLDADDRGGWFGLSAPGLFGRSTRDVRAGWRVLTASGDPTEETRREAVRREAETFALDITVLDIRDVPDPDGQTACALATAAELLRSLGHRVTPGTPDFLAAGSGFHRRFAALAAAGLAHEIRSWERALGEPIVDRGLDPSTRNLLRLADDPDTSDATRRWPASFRSRVSRWWDSGPDVLVTPVLAGGTMPLGWFSDPDEGGRRVRAAMRFTAQFNVSGDPAISLPLHRTPAGLPVGVQLVAAHGRDELLLGLAADLERVVRWGARRPRMPSVRTPASPRHDPSQAGRRGEQVGS